MQKVMFELFLMDQSFRLSTGAAAVLSPSTRTALESMMKDQEEVSEELDLVKWKHPQNGIHVKSMLSSWVNPVFENPGKVQKL